MRNDIRSWWLAVNETDRQKNFSLLCCGRNGITSPTRCFLRACCTRHILLLLSTKSFYLFHVAFNSWVALQGSRLKHQLRDRQSWFQVSCLSWEGSTEVTGAERGREWLAYPEDDGHSRTSLNLKKKKSLNTAKQTPKDMLPEQRMLLTHWEPCRADAKKSPAWPREPVGKHDGAIHIGGLCCHTCACPCMQPQYV